MGKILRSLLAPLKETLAITGKVIVLYGPRQVGKTTLVEDLLQEVPYRTLAVNADEERFSTVLSSRDRRLLLDFVHGYDLLFIDEVWPSQNSPAESLSYRL